MYNIFLRIFSFALLFYGVTLSVVAHAAGRPDHLTIGLLPGESAPTVMRLNEPLRLYLEKRLGMPVKLVVGANYAATGEALRFGRMTATPLNDLCRSANFLTNYYLRKDNLSLYLRHTSNAQENQAKPLRSIRSMPCWTKRMKALETPLPLSL
jgi:hypothetical protein